MPHQHFQSSTPAPLPSRRAPSARGASNARTTSLVVASLVALAGAGLAGCAGLLGIEEATCDPTYDPRCTGSSVGTLLPAAGSGGSGVGGSAGSGVGGSAGAAGSLGSAGAGGDSAGAGGAPVTEERPLCERYCDTVAAACTGANEQYASPMACRAVCALLEPGVPMEVGKEMGNTVECRLARAALAQGTGEASGYCHSAGPGGGGVCGTDCEGFCTLMAQTCAQMGSYDACLPLCGAVPNLTDEDESVTYDTSIQGGDSVQCRLYHVTAATLDSRMHCSHAAGVALCVDAGLQ
jgi:hypothetical protein